MTPFGPVETLSPFDKLRANGSGLSPIMKSPIIPVFSVASVNSVAELQFAVLLFSVSSQRSTLRRHQLRNALLREIENSTNRIVDLVRAVKEYSFMEKKKKSKLCLDGLPFIPAFITLTRKTHFQKLKLFFLTAVPATGKKWKKLAFISELL